jgi:hypothetical protein
VALKELLQYRHARMRANDLWTVAAALILPPSEQLERLKEAFADEHDDFT